jgi:hypothetical protein
MPHRAWTACIWVLDVGGGGAAGALSGVGSEMHEQTTQAQGEQHSSAASGATAFTGRAAGTIELQPSRRLKRMAVKPFISMNRNSFRAVSWQPSDPADRLVGRLRTVKSSSLSEPAGCPTGRREISRCGNGYAAQDGSPQTLFCLVRQPGPDPNGDVHRVSRFTGLRRHVRAGCGLATPLPRV